MDDKCHKMYPEKYLHLFIIGVLPEKQGLGLASLLLNPIIEKAKSENTPIFLETACEKNICIYKKKGFATYGNICESGITLTLMKMES
jgi:GNAT superfamily N-acetyltransferase